MAVPVATKSSYLSKDYVSLRDELIKQIPIVSKGQWTDLNDSDPGIVLLETFMSMVDNLMFYLDMQCNELDIERAKQRKNVISLLKLIGYKVNSVSAATGTVTVRVSPNESPIYPVYVSKGTQFSAQKDTQSITYTALGATTLAGPSDTKTIQVIQGTQSIDVFTSDGTPNQKFVLTLANIDKSSVQVFIDNDLTDNEEAKEWELVESFYKSKEDSKHFTTEVDEFSRVYISFSDGQFGAIPPYNATITINYIQTKGLDGNVGKNAINKVVSGAPLVADSVGNKVELLVVNSQATAGGDDQESIDKAKKKAIGNLFGLGRALSKTDYTSIVEGIPNVTKAAAWGEDEEAVPDYRLLNKVRLTFFSKEFSDMFYNPASRASYRTLRDNIVRKTVAEKMPVTTRLVFVDPVLVDIFVTIHIGIDVNQYDPNIVIDLIRTSILDFYSFDNVSFGQDIRLSAISSLINSVPGVAWARISRLYTTPEGIGVDEAPNPPMDIILEKWKIPTFGDVSTIPTVSEPTNVVPPYLQLAMPSSYFVGVNDIQVINPDGQLDIYTNGYTYYPGTNINHINITYEPITDEPYPSGGYYGHPNPETDLTTYSPV